MPARPNSNSPSRGRPRTDVEALQAAFALVSEAVVVLTPDGAVQHFNPAAERLFDWTSDEIVGRSVLELVPEGAHPAATRLIDSCLKGDRNDTPQPASWSTRACRRDGTILPVELRLAPAPTASGLLIVGVVRDVSERHTLKHALEESEHRYRELFENLGDAAFVADPGTGLILSTNRRGEELIGRPRDQIVGMHQTELHPAGQSAKYADLFAEAGKGLQHNDVDVVRSDGSRISVEISSVPFVLQGRRVVLGLFRDVTERRRDAVEMLRLNWALKAIGRSNAALVHAASERELAQRCCDAVTIEGGYELAWVGWANDDADRTIDIAARAGTAATYASGLRVTWDDSASGRGPAGGCIRSGSPVVFDCVPDDPALAHWSAALREFGLASALAVPIRGEGRVVGVMCVYSSSPSAFGPAEVELFTELSDDLAYGLEARKTRTAYEASLVDRELQAVRIRSVLESAIGAVAAIVEKRDPYTAGHERRVADLAAAIARELGLDPGRIEGLHLAGIVHDIGKVQVPAEILSKPTKLLPVEFELIKLHPQAGWEILKDIKFPWPIAEIVLQHHEYLDGSGYPHGRRGSEILLEARIMTVADIVEAMASHRPYRPGLGIDAALEQIGKMRGDKLDEGAVDACTRLFRERGYRLPA